MTANSLLHLEFSDSMKTDFDIYLIDESVLKIFVVLEDEDSSIELKDLTWNVESFQGKHMVIKLTFKFPLSISNQFRYDQIVVQFLDIKDYFISAEHLVDLSEDSRFLTHKIPR